MATELSYGASRAFRKVVNRIDYYAKSPWPVLLLGETGVGKELLAQRIHDQSYRSRNPFVPVNCAAIPASLFESELFGYERGAFSGAVNSSRGLVRSAHGGTLFLDEIGDIELPLQAKLLRLLESGEVRSVGATKVESVDVRVIAATNINLFRAVREGKFRLDLLERLSILSVRIPSLKDRVEDIPGIVEAIASRHGIVVEPEVIPFLQGQSWRGNIRQLRNLLLRAGVLGQSKVTLELADSLLKEEEMAFEEPSEEFGITQDGTLEEIERQVIVERLKRCHGNRKKAAEVLGIAKSTLHEKLRRWKMESPEGVDWPLARWGAAATSSAVCEL